MSADSERKPAKPGPTHASHLTSKGLTSSVPMSRHGGRINDHRARRERCEVHAAEVHARMWWWSVECGVHVHVNSLL